MQRRKQCSTYRTESPQNPAQYTQAPQGDGTHHPSSFLTTKPLQTNCKEK